MVYIRNSSSLLNLHNDYGLSKKDFLIKNVLQEVQKSVIAQLSKIDKKGELWKEKL